MPGEFHGQRSLAGYSPWGREESDTTEPFSLTQWEAAVSHRELSTVTCDDLEEWDGVRIEGKIKREGTSGYIELMWYRRN